MGSCCIAQGTQLDVMWWPRGVWWGRGVGREDQEGGGYIYIYIHIHITDSLCCGAEANTILQSHYTPMKKERLSKVLRWAETIGLICCNLAHETNANYHFLSRVSFYGNYLVWNPSP